MIGDDGSCDLSQWRNPDPSTPRPFDCGVCGCENGEVLCEERPCLPTRPIVECPDDSWRLLLVTTTPESGFVGDKYHAEVMGPGGCGADDYVFCYTPPMPSGLGFTDKYVLAKMMTRAKTATRCPFKPLT